MNQQVLSPRYKHGFRFYQVHDVAILKNDGKKVEASVAYSIDDGPLLSSLVDFAYGGPRLDMIDFKETPALAEIEGFSDEVLEDLREAAAYQRDLNRELN